MEKRVGPATPFRERAKGWFSGRRPYALVGVLIMAMLIAAPSIPGFTSASPAPPTVTPVPGSETPVATPTPGRGSLSAPEMKLLDTSKYGAVLATAKGSVRIELFHMDAPLATNNFVALARGRYYQASTIYKVEPSKYTAMGGLNEDGTGTPGYTIDPDQGGRPPAAGSLAMLLQNGKVSSQFIIATGDGDPGVPHVVVGRVTDGLDIVRELKAGDKINALNITETR